MVGFVLAASVGAATGQEAGGAAAEAAKATALTPAAETTKAEEKAAAQTTDKATVGDAKQAGDKAAESKGGVSAVTAAGGPPPATKDGAPPSGKAAAPAASTGLSPLIIAAIVVAILVLPVLAGNYLARQWKMPDHGWKFALTLGVLAASIVIVITGEFRFGPDLAGGITLIYELADTEGKEVPMDALINALKTRVDPTGTREVTIRSHGSAVEIIIPKTGQDALTFVKRRITDLGQLEFRITADPRRSEIKNIIAQANLLTPGQKDVMIAGEKVAEWVPYEVKEFGQVDQPDNRLIKRLAGDVPEALVLIEPWNVTGDYLTSSVKGTDERGGWAVHFSFNSRGAALFRRLTGDNLPNTATGVYRYLGIILDKRLISAPSINSVISDRGTISGGSMDENEVEYIVGILNAGRLPATLNKTPISEEVISPTLGAETIAKGEDAIVVSMIAVFLFLLVFYRYLGVIACLTLILNLLMVVSLMVLIKAAFTLPGLAGLALTVGMSVDANVLVFERIREELRGGAALRMAIRNGFGRAMSAIIDTNVTTVIAGLVLYTFATDQVKGFAVTLVLGIVTSMFSAVFFARVVFDVAERRGWLKNVRMMHLFTDPDIDFLKMRYWAIGASLLVIAVGMIAVYFRGDRLFDVDFTGGSSVAFTLREPMELPEVRTALNKPPLSERNLVVVERGTTHTQFSLDTSEQDVDLVKRLIEKEIGEKLKKYSVEIQSVTPVSQVDFKGVEAKLAVNADQKEYDDSDGIAHDALADRLRKLLDDANLSGTRPILSSDLYQTGSAARYKEWSVRLPDVDEPTAQKLLGELEKQLEAESLFPHANTIGDRISAAMQTQAGVAILLSLISVLIYLRWRFLNVTYGLAAAIAVVHDVIVTVGFLALSAYIVAVVPGLAKLLQIDSFQINLTVLAALLTIMGYQINDTIVTFDRLREVKGKSPRLTAEMVNKSVNQTLSRTLLTTVTVFMVVLILYLFGGEGIHGFAFSFLVGIIAGTYSTIFIAAPILLWLSGSSSSLAEKEGDMPAVNRPASALSR
jgi:SecD/SecF fusion protein